MKNLIKKQPIDNEQSHNCSFYFTNKKNILLVETQAGTGILHSIKESLNDPFDKDDLKDIKFVVVDVYQNYSAQLGLFGPSVKYRVSRNGILKMTK